MRMKWNKMDVLKVINTVVSNNSVEYSEINEQLSEYFGISKQAVICSRVSIMRCFQGFEPSSEKGDKKGYNFGKIFTETVNEWYHKYQGGLSRTALSHKFN